MHHKIVKVTGWLDCLLESCSHDDRFSRSGLSHTDEQRSGLQPDPQQLATHTQKGGFHADILLLDWVLGWGPAAQQPLLFSVQCERVSRVLPTLRVPEKCFLACHHLTSKSGYEAHKGIFHSPRAPAPASCPSGMGASSLEMSKNAPLTGALNNRNMFSYSPGD